MAERICVPGLLCVRVDGRIETGEQAGWDEICPLTLAEAKFMERFVERSELAELAREAPQLLPEHQVDAQRYPALYRWLSGLPLLVVDEQHWPALEDRGLRSHLIGFHRVSDGFGIGSSGGAEPETSLSGATYEFAREGESELERAVRSDRLLACATNGRLTQSAVLAAGVAHQLLHPRIAEDSPLRISPRFFEASKASYDVALGELWRKADEQREQAVALTAEISGAADSATALELPGLGTATRHVFERLEVKTAQSDVDYSLDGQRQVSAVLAPWHGWSIAPEPSWQKLLPLEPRIPFLLPLPWYRRAFLDARHGGYPGYVMWALVVVLSLVLVWLFRTFRPQG